MAIQKYEDITFTPVVILVVFKGVHGMIDVLKSLELETREMKRPEEGQTCEHTFLEQWGDDFVCCDCAARREKYKI